MQISPGNLLNVLCSVADRGAAYLVGTSRSVGRGWPFRPLPTRILRIAILHFRPTSKRPQEIPKTITILTGCVSEATQQVPIPIYLPFQGEEDILSEKQLKEPLLY